MSLMGMFNPSTFNVIMIWLDLGQLFFYSFSACPIFYYSPRPFFFSFFWFEYLLKFYLNFSIGFLAIPLFIIGFQCFL